MSERTSCIEHPASTPFVQIREEYLKMCGGDHCPAALLAVFEHWHNVKLSAAQQGEVEIRLAAKERVEPAQTAELWVYKSYDDLKTDLLGLFGETKIAAGVKFLIANGYLSVRCNPRFNWDKTPQYLFHPSNVQAAITQNYGSRRRKNTSSMPRKNAVSRRKNTPAIPYNTTEITPVAEPPRAAIFGLYEDLCGMSISPLVYQDLKDAAETYSSEWIEAAFKEAHINNVKRWNYVLTILKRWAVEGRDTKSAPTAKFNPMAGLKLIKADESIYT